MLTVRGIEFDVLTLGIDYQREELIAIVPQARSLPQVFLDGVHIGDHIALHKHLTA
ncbi:hypothetical protein FDI24_gp240 [Acidovorax phage ACP17]|uniref:Glutaredoxin n=1 Tax=Acidovorax phage ACP17 TaxID=2010329 RepID=A0A218M3A4_9CAUD|nr:hypothetical protein FDI24_gp240 [Acidovorax phage ACP17]ASD50521.1 hypothetical protein [Acidovorax phage ACP17]